MSNETTNPVVKWILIGICVVSLCVVGALFLLGTYPVGEYRAAKELEKRGLGISYYRFGNNIWQYPVIVTGGGQSITEDDSQLMGQLPHLQSLYFYSSDLSGLNLDDIKNCQYFSSFYCDGVAPFPADEIRKLAAYSIHAFGFVNSCLNDSDMEDFAKWTTVDCLYLDRNAGITDAVFEHLEKIASLRLVRLTGTSVTKEGIEEFKKKRPGVEVIF